MQKILLNSKAIPRWIIMISDLCVNCSSFAFSYFITKNFEFTEILRGHFFIYTSFYFIISGPVFYFFHVHNGLIRYSNSHDILKIFGAVFVCSMAYLLASQLFITGFLKIDSLNTEEALLINFFIDSSILIMVRIAGKEVYYAKRSSKATVEKIAIFGAGDDAVFLKQAIESGENSNFFVEGFIEIRSDKINTYIHQKKVYHLKELAALKARKGVGKLLMVDGNNSLEDKRLVIDFCIKHGIKVLAVPPTKQWIYGKLNLRQIREIKIEDLLQREPIVMNNRYISEELLQKKILVTGAAGSIGSEIVRQVLSYHPAMVILCDQAESALHNIQLEIEEKYPGMVIKIFIANVRDKFRMQILFKNYQPDIIFHAAAYKHVPMMEHHPCEAILTNVLGTKIVADLAIQYSVSKFVMISTDKAVNPSNVMGTSKRIAEMYVQSLNNDNSMDGEQNNYHDRDAKVHKYKPMREPGCTKFITTRFGNVLGSNGSVIPRFNEQIQKGGPVTVTDAEITRFFMTIPEAVQLVLEAAAMGVGGEIFVFDMGKPVKIVDLAKKMIQLAGYIPGEEIKIVFTGLRPGEKLYEELLSKAETTLPTHHEKIKVAKVVPATVGMRNEIERLITLSMLAENEEVVKKMKVLVPEFVSKNSKYEALDTITDIRLVAVSAKLLQSH